MKATMSDRIRVDFRVYLEPVLAFACKHVASKCEHKTMSKYIRYAVIRALKADGYPLDNVSDKFESFNKIPSTLEEKARRKLNYEVQKGSIIPPDKCDKCGITIRKSISNRRRIYAHHKDYSKPLDVIWLCNYCHNDIHANHSDIKTNNNKGVTANT